jgi:hypothetical protein
MSFFHQTRDLFTLTHDREFTEIFGNKRSKVRIQGKVGRTCFGSDSFCHLKSALIMTVSDPSASARPFGDFPEEEEAIIQCWRDTNAFLKSYELSIQEGRKPYVFYDGPPFATVCSYSCVCLTLGSSTLRPYFGINH